jgi:hypothetical protein
MPTDLADPGLWRVFWGVLAAACMLGIIGLTFYALTRGRGGGGPAICISVRVPDVTVSGPASGALRQELVHFFTNDFPPKEKLDVYARKRAAGGYDLRFSGPVSAGERQQVRNFLTTRR